MSNSEKGIRGTGGRTAAQPRRFRPTRYDILLGVIPVIFGLALAIAVFSSVTLQLALLVGAVAGGVVMFDALFRNPPLREDDR